MFTHSGYAEHAKQVGNNPPETGQSNGDLGQPATPAATKPLTLPCKWTKKSDALNFHYFRMPEEKQKAAFKSLVAEGKASPPTKAIVLPALPYETPAQRAKKVPPREMYGLSTRLDAYLFLQLEIELLKRLQNGEEQAKQEREQGIAFLGLDPVDPATRGMAVLALMVQKQGLAQSFFESMTKFPEMADAWRAIPRPFKEEGQEKVATQTFDQAIALPSASPGDPQSAKSRKTEIAKLSKRLSEDPVNAAKLMKTLMLSAANLLEKPWQAQAQSQLSNEMTKFFDGTGDLKLVRKEMAKIRTQLVLENLPKVICDLSSSPLPAHFLFPVAMGVDASRAIKEIGTLKDVDGNDVPIRVLD